MPRLAHSGRAARAAIAAMHLAMHVICPLCQASISPARICRLNSEESLCPECGKVYRVPIQDARRRSLLSAPVAQTITSA